MDRLPVVSRSEKSADRLAGSCTDSCSRCLDHGCGSPCGRVLARTQGDADSRRDTVARLVQMTDYAEKSCRSWSWVF